MAISGEWPTPEEATQSYIIIGAGVFGASAALQLKRTKPKAKIILIDRLRTNPAAASFDLSKIIRADYRDIFYMKLALEAQHEWQNNALYKPYFHQTGMLFAENSAKGPAFLRNYSVLGVPTSARLMAVDEARLAFPALAQANWQGVRKAYFNPLSGWGEAAPALKAVINAAVAAGVQFHTGTVEKLLLRNSVSQSNGANRSMLQCIGVILRGGVELQANNILLCTGAATARLLADSAPSEPMFQAGGRLVASAALSVTVNVDPAKRHFYRDAPVFANLMSHTSGTY
jgi:sarcosine oxidase / L-pipecolate oxidase